MWVLDTSVAVDHLRGHAPASELLGAIVASEEDLVASEVVRFERLTGVRDDELDTLERFCSVLAWVPIDAGVARLGASLVRRFCGAHPGIDDADYLIAATALLVDGSLLTVNVRHFPMLEGLVPPTD